MRLLIPLLAILITVPATAQRFVPDDLEFSSHRPQLHLSTTVESLSNRQMSKLTVTPPPAPRRLTSKARPASPGIESVKWEVKQEAVAEPQVEYQCITRKVCRNGRCFMERVRVPVTQAVKRTVQTVTAPIRSTSCSTCSGGSCRSSRTRWYPGKLLFGR